MDKQWREFIEDADGVGSAARLNMLVGVVVGAGVVMWLAAHFQLSEGIFGVFMLATGGVYGFGKWQDGRLQIEQARACRKGDDDVAG